MIVDDERVLREAFAAFFGDRSWHPILANSGEEALVLLKDRSTDAILVDIRLPGMAGDEFIRKAHQLDTRMVFVICTGSPEYTLPKDLLQNPRVSNQVFRKPLARLVNLENEIFQLLEFIE